MMQRPSKTNCVEPNAKQREVVNAVRESLGIPKDKVPDGNLHVQLMFCKELNYNLVQTKDYLRQLYFEEIRNLEPMLKPR